MSRRIVGLVRWVVLVVEAQIVVVEEGYVDSHWCCHSRGPGRAMLLGLCDLLDRWLLGRLVRTLCDV